MSMLTWKHDASRETSYYEQVNELLCDGRVVLTLWWRKDLKYWLYRKEGYVLDSTERVEGTLDEAKAVALVAYRMGDKP